MRRHPLIVRATRLCAGLLASALLAGCGSDPAATALGVTITTAPGETLAFQPAETTIAPAGLVRVTFRNASSLPHNLVFTGGLTAATRTIVSPSTSDELVVGPVTPGRYPFVCTIHDGMAGMLVAQEP